jgi:hypothetical protein
MEQPLLIRAEFDDDERERYVRLVERYYRDHTQGQSLNAEQRERIRQIVHSRSLNEYQASSAAADYLYSETMLGE